MIEVLKQLVNALENHSAIKHPQQIHYRDEAIQAGKQAIAELESQKPFAYVNVEMRRLEFAQPIKWYTPTVVNLDRIPLFTKEALEQDQNIWSRSADGSVKIIYEE
jgi:aminoglycoside phosphotransferase